MYHHQEKRNSLKDRPTQFEPIIRPKRPLPNTSSISSSSSATDHAHRRSSSITNNNNNNQNDRWSNVDHRDHPH